MEQTVKKQVRELLLQKDYTRLVDLCTKYKRFWMELKFSLYDIDETIKWPAIEAVGELMKHWWEQGDKAKVREYIRNLFWSMNDESGGIGWSSPQTIAEIIVDIPELIDPYGNMMVAHSLEEPFFVKGALWGIGKLGELIIEAVDFFRDKVLAAFNSDDAETLGLAAWSMGETGFKPALIFLRKLSIRTEPVCIYIEGEFEEKTLGEWAKEAIDKIEKMVEN
jgi:hypothetical protein